MKAFWYSLVDSNHGYILRLVNDGVTVIVSDDTVIRCSLCRSAPIFNFKKKREDHCRISRTDRYTAQHYPSCM